MRPWAIRGCNIITIDSNPNEINRNEMFSNDGKKAKMLGEKMHNSRFVDLSGIQIESIFRIC